MLTRSLPYPESDSGSKWYAVRYSPSHTRAPNVMLVSLCNKGKLPSIHFKLSRLASLALFSCLSSHVCWWQPFWWKNRCFLEVFVDITQCKHGGTSQLVCSLFPYSLLTYSLAIISRYRFVLTLSWSLTTVSFVFCCIPTFMHGF